MQYTRLGRSGLMVSRIGLGCMSYGTPVWRPWVLDEAAAGPFFRRAIELGINFFDTADMYSLGESERVTARWLREYGQRDELVIATKFGLPMGAGPNRTGTSRKHIEQACEASLRRLGVEAIDLYQVHRFDPRTPLEETLEALDRLVVSGKVRYLGASSTYAWRLMKALALSDQRGLSRFVSMQNHFNLLYREEQREMLPLCAEEGVGVIPWSPLARGRLARAQDAQSTRADSDTLANDMYQDDTADQAVIAANRQLAARLGVPPAQTALAWVLGTPGVVAPIIGATRAQHLEDAVAALELQLSAADRAGLEAAYRPRAVSALLDPTAEGGAFATERK